MMTFGLCLIYASVHTPVKNALMMYYFNKRVRARAKEL